MVALPLRVGVAGAALLAIMLAPQPWLKAVAAFVVVALAVWDAEPWVYLAAFCIPFSFVRVAAGPLLFSPADVAVWAAFVGWAVRAIRVKMQTPGVEASAGDQSVPAEASTPGVGRGGGVPAVERRGVAAGGA